MPDVLPLETLPEPAEVAMFWPTYLLIRSRDESGPERTRSFLLPEPCGTERSQRGQCSLNRQGQSNLTADTTADLGMTDPIAPSMDADLLAEPRLIVEPG